jgi:nitroreductase
MSFLDSLNWRNAAKSFDPTKKVTDQDLQSILDAVHLTPTSFGLQPYHLYVVSNPELKQKLQDNGYNQPQFTECSHVLVFAARTDAAERVETYFELASGGNAEVKANLQGYKDMMLGFIGNMDSAGIENWAKKQAYIALGFALAACAELHVDSCPMEGFASAEFDKILNLPTNQKSCVVLTIGYRTEEPKHPKVRFLESELITSL